MSRVGPSVAVPCGVCGARIDYWDLDMAQPCGHTLMQIREAWDAALALGEGQPAGTPLQRRPAPRDPERSPWT